MRRAVIALTLLTWTFTGDAQQPSGLVGTWILDRNASNLPSTEVGTLVGVSGAGRFASRLVVRATVSGVTIARDGIEDTFRLGGQETILADGSQRVGVASMDGGTLSLTLTRRRPADRAEHSVVTRELFRSSGDVLTWERVAVQPGGSVRPLATLIYRRATR